MSDDFRKLFAERNLGKMGIPWGKIYDLSIIRKFKVRFPETVKFCEDLLFMLTYLRYAEYVRFIDVTNYHYSFLNENSLIRSYHSFGTELSGYSLFRDKLKEIKSQFSLTDNNLSEYYLWLHHLAMRAVKTIFRPGKNLLPYSIRANVLEESFTAEDLKLIGYYGRQKTGIDNFISWLMAKRLNTMVNLILSLFFSVRYSKVGMVIIKQRRKRIL